MVLATVKDYLSHQYSHVADLFARSAEEKQGKGRKLQWFLGSRFVR